MPLPPKLLITLGDVAGIGPEIVVRGWKRPELHELCRPCVVGDTATLRNTAQALKIPLVVEPVDASPDGPSSQDRLPCLQGTDQDLGAVPPRKATAPAGRAAYDFLCAAIDRTLDGEAAGIVTLPLHKEGLRAAGCRHPGHTEILAERTGTARYAMMLYFEGLGVTHVTLHMALRDVFRNLHTEAVLEKIELTATMMQRLIGRPARIGVCGLNPHASDGGLFGDEEQQLIAPAVAQAIRQGIDASGPWPSDTLFLRARRGAFDGVVAMYHDQGHIALKLLADYRAVNITLGLPLVRTSVAHGTAYDIVGRGLADPTGFVEAVRIAARLASTGTPAREPREASWPRPCT